MPRFVARAHAHTYSSHKSVSHAQWLALQSIEGVDSVARHVAYQVYLDLRESESHSCLF